MHSATTETVRLPDDGNNGVIVHTAMRIKVPLKKKVRGERKKNQQSSSATNQKESNTAANSATRKPTLNVANRQIKMKESPRKTLYHNKKKRSQSGEVEEQSQQVSKALRRTKGSQKSKEIIDYSNPQQHLNTFGKVQKWLLESPIVASATSQFEHGSKTPTTTMMNKSQSNPENLSNAITQHKQHRSPINTSSKPKMKAMNNKMRLQVVFKPPFKFSLKLSKNENAEKTNESNRKHDSRKRNSIDNQVMPKRTALLIRSNVEEAIDDKSKSEFINQEPMYETLNSKIISSHRQSKSATSNAPNYENLPTTSSTANLIDATLNNSFSSPINTATFRVNKSSSGNNITNKNLPVISTSVLRNSSNVTNASHRENQKRRLSASNSSSNLIKFGGSTQNLTRSSTTNLTKNQNSSTRHDGIKRRASDMNRSSTTNLNKHNRHNTSNSNLRRGDSYVDVSNEDRSSSNEKKSHSRKSSLSKSNSNLANASVSQTGSSRRESFNKNNIPRASLINSTIANALSNTPFQRQISFNFKPTPLSKQSRVLIDELNKNRPQTSSCDSSMFKNFEWPRVLSTQRSLPAENALQSDMEVMVSDGETLENDS